MNYKPTKLLLLSAMTFFVIGLGFLRSQIPQTGLPWKSIWHDDFSVPALDPAKWCRNDWRAFVFDRYTLSAFRTDQVYSPDNLQFIAQGTDSIVRQYVLPEQRTRMADDDSILGWNPIPHTYSYSAPSWFQSKAKFKYGYFEARLRLPQLGIGQTNQGLGANFWLYKDTQGQAPQSEIDIVEFVADPVPQIHTCNAHYYTINYTDSAHSYRADRIMPNDGQFHTFGAWWGPDFVKFYIDGQYYRDVGPEIPPIADEMIPMTIILDINVFTKGEFADSTTRLPYHFDIDYVRVFQIDTEQCQNDYAQPSPMAALNSVYRNITFGGGSAMPANASKNLTARNAISIKPDFEAPLGSELTLSIYPYCHENIAVTSCPACNCD